MLELEAAAEGIGQTKESVNWTGLDAADADLRIRTFSPAVIVVGDDCVGRRVETEELVGDPCQLFAADGPAENVLGVAVWQASIAEFGDCIEDTRKASTRVFHAFPVRDFLQKVTRMKAVAYLAAADMSLLRYVVVNKVAADGTVLPCHHVSATASWAQNFRELSEGPYKQNSSHSSPPYTRWSGVMRSSTEGPNKALPLYHSKVE